jgi:hypothetical protein
MSFVAILKQCSDGCDYTIGCGVKVIQLEAGTWAEAKAEARRALKEDYRQDYERCLDDITILEVSEQYSVPVNTLYDEIRREEADEQAGHAKDKRRQEYERLKREFGEN